ncbi:MAG TPA: hypothetical protein ENK98_04460 [Epsilonproteobacteria bacterium]|jgi:lipid-binding SYLF domain-containing protein|nr:hypothetical protein [Campylobacterota bacterium]
MKKNIFSPLALIVTCLLFTGHYAQAESAAVLNAKADDAITHFKNKIQGGEKFLSQVKGYLVFPSVVKGGFVVGGEYGEGVLRVNGQTKAYYSMASGSIGLQAGLQKTSYLIAFVSQTALDNFMKSDGWEAGVDGSVTVVNLGLAKDIKSISFEKPIYVFVYDAEGLMYNLTLEGTKFTKITPK